MLRPATPLTVLLSAAFVLLLLSVLSTPVIKQIPLASFDGVSFGVFGFCKDGEPCSKIEIGYNFATVYGDSKSSSSFDLATSTRTTLSAILIVHPIAALFTLIMLILAASAHFHSPSHSPRYLLGLFILSILTLILALLSFLIDVLLFVPHMAWGSYLVLAATVLIAASGIVSCAMRRTLVNRKARKRRIAENAEMNGENFYNREGRPNPLTPNTGDATLVNGGPGVDKLPTFATFETAKKDPDRSSDERVPLTTRSPTEGPSPTNMPGAPGIGMNDRYGSPVMTRTPPPRPPRDQYGNAMPLGAQGGRSRDPSLNRQYSDPAMRGRGMPPAGYRGRGGYPPNGRGGYGSQRGGYGAPRGAYGPPRGGYGGPPRGGRGGPPPGYGPPQDGRGYDRGPSPGNYNRGPAPTQGAGYGGNVYSVPPPTGDYAAYNPEDNRGSLPRAESPPPLPGFTDGPVGQAVEMDATTGSPSHAPQGYGQFDPIRESDGDVAGMVGLQRQKMQRETVVSESSRYSTEDYVPPRQAWGAGAAGRSSPLNSTPQAAETQNSNAVAQRRESADNYYEDVEPRFSDQPGPSSLVPAALAPGYPPNGNSRGNLQPISNPDANYSYEDVQSGSRSPAESDRSNFTSISERGINPRWNPGAGNAPPMPNRRPVNPPQQQQDLLLASNPDFMLPGGRGGQGGRGRAPGQF
ncbi:uncharacterized protein BP5553_09576 [Venustampulla echinocandica]|uniref:Pali-domain-containing protein n=1 Tax=Venustampulla echinocandica TaxID=2656787 RepID=A0A370TBF3_9HELO|nr:uncharacterized protein BP5553_09576 [Venustampulla echinocandica]RDL31367.1 hypothetical protein BP5553_09576 [Venustampulla echinocandica]